MAAIIYKFPSGVIVSGNEKIVEGVVSWAGDVVIDDKTYYRVMLRQDSPWDCDGFIMDKSEAKSVDIRGKDHIRFVRSGITVEYKPV